MPRHLWTLLRRVSRSFYLTLRILPRAIRDQIGLAYLLARATDTVADTGMVPVARRLEALKHLHDAILLAADGRDGRDPELPQPGGDASAAERELMTATAALLHELRRLPPDDRSRVRQVLSTITSGQELDLQRFGTATAGQLSALRTGAELDDYTYRVAGCVGEFWTRMCRAHVFPAAKLDDEFLVSAGVCFGKGLQLVNVLRDIPGDLRRGRCYIPEGELAKYDLVPEDLLDAASMERFRPVYLSLVHRAEDHLRTGWNYTNALPRAQVRVRLACAWPVLIGLRTLAYLRAGNVLDARSRIKISRAEVRSIVLQSIVSYPSAKAWNRLFERKVTSLRTEPQA